MSYSLFLDDIRYPKQVTWVKLPLVEWKIVRSYKEFVNCIKQHGLPTRVTFDHDLCPEHYNHDWSGASAHLNRGTGYDCVRWLCAYCRDNHLPFPEYYLHTMSPAGLQNMDNYIKSFKKTNKQKVLAKRKN